MMTKMSEDGLEFDEVLADAKERGYAEKDATADVRAMTHAGKLQS